LISNRSVTAEFSLRIGPKLQGLRPQRRTACCPPRK